MTATNAKAASDCAPTAPIPNNQQSLDQSSTDVQPAQEAIILTPTESRALKAVCQRQYTVPGAWDSYFGRGVTTRTLNRLAARGLISRRRTLAGRHAAWHGRRRSVRTAYRDLYRVTEAGAALFRPALPPVVVEPHLVLPLTDAARANVRELFGVVQGWPSIVYPRASQRLTLFDGDRVTAVVTWPDQTGYGPHLLLWHLLAAMRLYMPRCVIEAARVEQGDGEAVVSLSFHIAGEPLLLLPAGDPLPAPEPKRALSAAAEAALVMLVDTGGWMRLDGLSDEDRRALERGHLVLTISTRPGEYAASDSGHTYVEVLRDPGPSDDEGTPDDNAQAVVQRAARDLAASHTIGTAVTDDGWLVNAFYGAVFAISHPEGAHFTCLGADEATATLAGVTA